MLRRSQASRRTTTLSSSLGTGLRPARIGSRTTMSREMRGSSGTTNQTKRVRRKVPVRDVSARLVTRTTVPVPQSSWSRSRRVWLSLMTTLSPCRATPVSFASIWTGSRAFWPGSGVKTTRAEPLWRNRIVPSGSSLPEGNMRSSRSLTAMAPERMRPGITFRIWRRSDLSPPMACMMASSFMGTYSGRPMNSSIASSAFMLGSRTGSAGRLRRA